MIETDWVQTYIASRIRLGGLLPNDGYITGVPKTLVSGGNFVGNVGTGLQTLFSFTFPAKSFKTDQQDCFHAILGGGFAANDDDKRLQLSFGGNVLGNTGLTDIDNFGFWIELIGVRLSPTLMNIITLFTFGLIASNSTPTLSSTGGQISPIDNNILTVNNMDTLSNELRLEGESATATNNNVICNVKNVQLTRF